MLREHHKDDYHHNGRWIVAGAVLVGWLAGVVIRLPDAVVGIMLGLLVGAIILNTLKDEVPAEGNSFIAFVAGAVGYVTLLLLT